MKLSVFLIVKNEEKNLGRALASVRWADEIVVVDSGSSDRTVEIAKQFTDNVYARAFTDYADQKNFAMSKASGDWLLSLDADEELTGPLIKEIRAAAADGGTDAYRIRRRSNIFGRWFRYTGTQDDKPVRLFRRGKARFVQPVHEKVTVEGSVGELKGSINHYTYPSMAEYMRRFNLYTSLEASYLAKQNGEPNFHELALKPAAMFFRLYFWKQGFRDGEEGFVFSWLSACYVFTKHAKQWEGLQSHG